MHRTKRFALYEGKEVKNMPATMKDVKNKTGLSMATISKYLNGGNVLPENRVLIEKAIKELNYEVNELARGLVKNKTKIVGVMVYDISSYFSGTMLHYIGTELRKKGYAMMICDSSNDAKVEEENLKFLINRKVDGIIVMPVSFSGAFLKPAKQAKIPVVLIDRAFQDEEFDCVCIDNRVAAYRAVDILIKNNHKKIAIIGSEVADTGIERYKGFREAMEQAGIPINPEYVKMSSFSVNEGFKMMKELLEMDNPPTAVLLSNYETALGGVMAVNESDTSCPDDISIFAFDDLLVANVVKPSLWLVVQPMETLCMNAVRLLMERILEERTDDPLKLCYGAKIREGTSIRNLG